MTSLDFAGAAMSFSSAVARRLRPARSLPRVYIFFSREGADETACAWRRQLRGISDKPIEARGLDVVVFEGGVTGVAAALTAARLGERVALIQNRPYMGGNASVEIGLRPPDVTDTLVDEISQPSPDGDLVAIKLVQAEPTATVFLEHTVYKAIAVNSTIVFADARDAHDDLTGREMRFAVPVFIDCSGTAVLGRHSGAETLFGQKSRAEYNECLAPVTGDKMHHGNTVFSVLEWSTIPFHSPTCHGLLRWSRTFQI